MCGPEHSSGSTSSVLNPSANFTTGWSSIANSGMLASRTWTSSSTSSKRRRRPMVAGTGSKAAPVNETSMELKGDREIVIERTFNGPARIVFDAWTRPELVKRWWAPRSRGVSLIACDADVRVGGTYRYVLRTDRGDEFAFSGVYREITPHSRLVYTQI